MKLITCITLFLLSVQLYSQDTLQLYHQLKRGDVFKMSVYEFKDGKPKLLAQQPRYGKFDILMEDSFVVKMLDKKVIYTISGLSETKKPVFGLSLSGYFKMSDSKATHTCWVGIEEYKDPVMLARDCLKVHVIVDVGSYLVFHVLDHDL
ncbi:MAG: hypothetical protein RIM99_06480 [Cyclobacteriaceae bacterium]